MSVAFAFNMYMLSFNQAPPGADYGNYLTQVNILNGQDLRGWGLRHQPVFFVLLDGFIGAAQDAFLGLKLAAAFVFSIIAVPFFLVAKKLSGSNVTSAISTAFFVFFIAYNEMISWGGNPNFLGFSFFLMALYFIIDFMKKPSKVNLLLIGLFLSLTIGTHILVAIFSFGFLALFGVLYFVFGENRKEKLKRSVKPIVVLLVAVAAFSLPYVTYYLDFFKLSSREMVSFSLFQLQFGELNVLDTMSLAANFAFIICISAAGVFWLAKSYIKTNKVNGLMLCSLLLVPVALYLTTAQPLRWLYFIPIPFLLCFSIYAKDLFSDVKHVKKATILLFTFLFLFTIVLQSSVLSYKHYVEATSFYQFMGQDELDAVEWIKNNTLPNDRIATSGSANNVGGGGNSYAWWVEGYAKRICMYTGDLEYYSFQFERDEVRKTNLLFAGTYTADNNRTCIAEGFPVGSDNPRISAFIQGKYADVLTVNDGQNQVYFSTSGNEDSYSIGSFYAENRSISESNSASEVNITVIYDQPSYTVIRSTIIKSADAGSDTSSVDVYYQIMPKNNTVISQIKLNLWSLIKTTPNNCTADQNSSVTLSGVLWDTIPETTNVTVETNCKLAGTRVYFADPKGSNPVVNYMLEPQQEILTVHLNIAVTAPFTKIKEEGVTAISFRSAYDLLGDLNINYIMLNRDRLSEVQRFTSDSEHFSLAYHNKAIDIFKVR